MEKEVTRVTVRLPVDVYYAVAKQATDEQRNINGQITYILKEATKKNTI